MSDESTDKTANAIIDALLPALAARFKPIIERIAEEKAIEIIRAVGITDASRLNHFIRDEQCGDGLEVAKLLFKDLSTKEKQDKALYHIHYLRRTGQFGDAVVRVGKARYRYNLTKIKERIARGGSLQA